MDDQSKDRSSAASGTTEVLQAEAFDPSEVRPWRFHNRQGSGMDDASLNSLASSIARTGSSSSGLRAGCRQGTRTRSRPSSAYGALRPVVVRACRGGRRCGMRTDQPAQGVHGGDRVVILIRAFFFPVLTVRSVCTN